MSIFHYTDANAIFSILQNRKIWLTDIRFMNDSKELRDGLDILSKALDTPQFGTFGNYAYEQKSKEFLKAAFSNSVNYGIDDEPIFVFSFSKRKDLLSQWRAYGSYAIEFDEKQLAEEDLSIKTCIYDGNKKDNKANYAVSTSLSTISHDMANNNGGPGPKYIDSLIDLIELAATFKDKGFQEEEEVRIILKASEDDEIIKFRPINNKLIPYIEMDITLDCIKAIHIGPISEQELVHTSMASFVRSIERNWQFEMSNIEYELRVETSSIPYRGNS